MASMIAARVLVGVLAAELDRRADVHLDERTLETDAGQAGVARPHHLGAPDTDGDDRRAGHGGEASGAPTTLQDRIEEGGPARDRALGGHGDEFSAGQGVGRRLERLVGPRGPHDADAAEQTRDRADDGHVEHLLLAKEAGAPAGLGDQQVDGRRVEVAAVVEDHDGRPARRDVLDAGELEARVGYELGPVERSEPLLQLAPRHLGDAGGDVEMANRPAPQPGEHGQLRIGVDGDGMADRGEQRSVEIAVGVEEAGPQVDRVHLRPLLSGLQLVTPPHEGPVERAGVLAVFTGPTSRQDVVEPEALGERGDQMDRRRRGEHEHPARLTVRLEQRGNERLDHVDELVGRSEGCRVHRAL